MSIAALVADDDDEIDESRFSLDSGRTSVPPGLGFSPTQLAERSSTPVPQTQTGPNVKSLAIPRPVTPLIPKVASRSTSSAKKESTPTSGNEAKKSIKELAAKSGLSKDIAAQASKTPSGKGVLQEEDFPALNSIKTSSPPKATPIFPSKLANSTAKTSQSKKATSETVVKAPVSKAAPNKSDKRPVPGILDIAAATKTVTQTSEAVSGTEKSASQVPTSAIAQKAQGASALATPTPTTASVSSPLAKVAPKTLRLVHTPKTEIPPAAVASIRAASMAGSSHRPATPASEIISDTASIVSASVSVSRTSSPPPSRVGTASVRATTKSQQRKQRKEASKEAAAQIAESKPAEKEVEIAPILGRKKKQKKEKKASAMSRPETPSIAETPTDTSAQKNASAPPADISEKAPKGTKTPSAAVEPPKLSEQKSKVAKSPPRSPVAVDTSIRLNESTKTTVLTPDYVGHTPETKQEQPTDEDVGEIPNLRDVFQSLVESGNLPDAEAVSFFKAIQGYRADMISSIPSTLPPTLKAIVTKEDEDKLNAFQPVQKTVNDHTVLLTPNGDCLLNLTESEAELFLELQDRLRADSLRPTAFAAPRHAPATGFSLMKNRAVPNGTPSYFPAGPDNYPSDPVGKMHREEAISCINQHVLPSLNLSGYKTGGNGPNAGRNLNLQQLAPWICPPTDGSGGGDQGKLFSGRAGDEFGQGGAVAAPGVVPPLPYNVFEGYDGSGSVSGNNGDQPSPSIGSRPLMSVEDAEAALAQAKKQHEALDKKLRQLLTRNRRLVGLH